VDHWIAVNYGCDLDDISLELHIRLRFVIRDALERIRPATLTIEFDFDATNDASGATPEWQRRYREIQRLYLVEFQRFRTDFRSISCKAAADRYWRSRLNYELAERIFNEIMRGTPLGTAQVHVSIEILTPAEQQQHNARLRITYTYLEGGQVKTKVVYL
jgi:hypothetical protein